MTENEQRYSAYGFDLCYFPPGPCERCEQIKQLYFGDREYWDSREGSYFCSDCLDERIAADEEYVERMEQLFEKHREKWYSRGKSYLPEEMTTQHLINAIAYANRTNVPDSIVIAMRHELTRRGENLALNRRFKSFSEYDKDDLIKMCSEYAVLLDYKSKMVDMLQLKLNELILKDGG